jgi:hypothetical protein
MSISFNRDNDFKTKSISGVGSKNDDIILEKMSSSSPSKVQNENLPLFSNNKIPDRKSRILGQSQRPILGANKKVPFDSFGGLANQKKSYANSESSYSGTSGSNNSESDSDSDDDDDDGLNSMISSNSSNMQSSSPYKNKYASSQDDDSGSEDGSDNEDDEDDGSEGGSSYSSGSGSGSEGSIVSEGSDDNGYHGHGGTGTGMNQGFSQPNRPLTYEEAQRRKQKVLFELDRLQKQGHQPSKKYTMASNLEDMEYERDCLKRQRDLDKSIKFSRKALMMVVSGIEYVNGKFDPFDIKLDGWSEKVMDDISDYDEVFEELHDKYGESVKMAPELRLLMTLAGSGFMFHLTNSLFKSSTPDLNDILKKNPDIVRSIQEAAIQNMNNGINTQFGANDPIGNMMKQGIQMKTGVPMNGPPPPIQSRAPPRSPPQMNNMFGPSRPQPTMRGPSGVDDLLNKLKSNSDEDTMSESSFNMRSSGKKGGLKKGKNGGIQIDLTD